MEYALLALALLTAFCASLHPIIEEDFWWHLKIGGDILGGRGIPHVDTYSYASEGRPYVDLHWLFQVLVFIIHSAAGLTGVILAKCAIATLTFWIVFRLARRDAPIILSAALTGLGAIMASERFLARPEILTFLFLAATLWLLRRHEEGSRRAWLFLPAVHLVWVNTEGLFILGLVAIGAHVAGRLGDRRLRAAFVLSTLAALANPYLVAGAVHPFVLLTRINGAMDVYSRTIGEFLTPFAPGLPHPAVAVFPYFLGVIGFALLLYGRRPPVRDLILMAAFLYLAFRARRNLALLAIVATPIVARWIDEGWMNGWARPFLRRIPDRLQNAGALSFAAGACVALLGYNLCLANGMIYEAIGTNRRFGLGLGEGGAPVGAAAFLRENRVPGPIFNNLSTGGYLIYAYPEEKVFIDGRLEVHSTEHYAGYIALLAGGKAWRAAEERYRWRSLILSYAEATELTFELMKDPSWAPVFLDGTAVVLLRDDTGNRATIEERRLTPATLRERFPVFSESDFGSLPPARAGSVMERLFRMEPTPWNEIYLGQFLGVLGMPELAAGQYVRAVHRAPHALTPRTLLAGALAAMGRREPALRVLDQAAMLARGARGRAEIARLRERIR